MHTIFSFPWAEKAAVAKIRTEINKVLRNTFHIIEYLEEQ